MAEVTSAAPPTQLGVKAPGIPEARRLKPEKVRWPFPGPVRPDIPTGNDNSLTTRLWKTPH